MHADPATVSSPRVPSQRFVHSPAPSSLPHRVITSDKQTNNDKSEIYGMAWWLTVTHAGLRPHRLRELCRRCRSGREARRAGAMGYGWPRRLRPSPTPFLPGFARHPHLLRCRLAGLARQRAREGTEYAHVSLTFEVKSADWPCACPLVDLGSPAFLPRPTHNPRGLQEGFEIRSEDDRGAAQDVAEAGDAGAGTQPNQVPLPAATR